MSIIHLFSPPHKHIDTHTVVDGPILDHGHTQNRNNIILIQTIKTETLRKYKMHPNNRELDPDAEVDTKSKNTWVLFLSCYSTNTVMLQRNRHSHTWTTKIPHFYM